MTVPSTGNGLPKSVSVAFEMFSRARQAVQRVFVPALVVMPDGCATANNVSVLTATTSPPQQVTFICDGYLIGVSASVQSGTDADASATKIAIIINGSTSIFQAGQQGTGYVPIKQLQSNGAAFFRLMAPIRQSVPYQIFVKNETGGTVVADVSLWYVNTSSPPITD